MSDGSGAKDKKFDEETEKRLEGCFHLLEAAIQDDSEPTEEELAEMRWLAENFPEVFTGIEKGESVDDVTV